MNLIQLLDFGYKLAGKANFQGLRISIENQPGSVRRGTDAGGNKWATKMKVAYGRIPYYMGADGEAVDVFLGKDANAPTAYIIQIMKPPKFTEPDEEKVFLGFPSAQAAKKSFLEHYDNPRFFGSIRALSMRNFKQALRKHPARLVA